MDFAAPARSCRRTLSTVGLASLLDETEAILGNAPFAAETMELLRRAYLAEGATMMSATRFLLHHWLGKYGLVVLDASAAALKKEASFLIQNELQHGEQTEALIAAQSRALEQAGFHAQAKPRALNLFYFENGQRKRIIYQAASDTFAIHDSMLQFSPQNMAQEIALHPERFSFNVITRPLYQQYILPNLAYIGGGGEIAYWLQLKTLFEARQIFFRH
ncbi:MAG: bacillithiol biosynthesis BshC [Sphingobacteriales bacterium]|nr:bacillithiol biosynthesis BshC [Sphingobacteriales bacterium]